MNMPDNLFASIDAICFLHAHLLPETRIRSTYNKNEVTTYLHEKKESDDEITTWMQMLDALDIFSNEEGQNDWTDMDMSLDGIIRDLEKSERVVSTPSSDLTDLTDLTDASVDADNADATIRCSTQTTKIMRRKRKTPKAKWTRKKRKAYKNEMS